MNKIIKQAFTLIELLVVIAIIGILSGLIVVTMSGATQKATIAKAQVFSNSLRNALALNLVSEWKFDGTTADGSAATVNDILDTWSNTNNGTIGNAPTVKTGSSCIYGSCLQFDGIDDYISFGNNSNLNITTGPFTVIFWSSSTTFKALAGFVGKKTSAWVVANPGWIIQYPNSPQKIYVAISNGTSNIQYNTGLNIIPMTQLGITRDDNNVVYFINNGVLTNIGTLAGDISNSVNLEVGRGYYNSTYGYVAGTIDDIRFFNAAIQTSQIKEQYYAGLNKLLANGSISNEEYKQRIEEVSLNK
jgi:prepilin-type N-terminal cleavage/methylation domain-containing protein